MNESKNKGKQAVYLDELAKLNKIFENIDENEKELVSCLMQDAAFLAADIGDLKGILENESPILIHPVNPEKKKVNEFYENLSNLCNKKMVTREHIVAKLYAILNTNAVEDDDDDLEDYE